MFTVNEYSQDLKKEEIIPIEKKEIPEVKKEVRVEKKREEMKREEPIDGWYTGIVTAVNDDSVFVASPQLNEDAVLYQRYGRSIDTLRIMTDLQTLTRCDGIVD